MNHTSIWLHVLSTPSLLPVFCPSIPLLLHPFCAFSSPLSLVFPISFLAPFSVSVSPPPHLFAPFTSSTPHPPHCLHSTSTPTLTDEYQTKGPALHAIWPTSNALLSPLPQAPLMLLCKSLLVSNCVFLCNYSPMNISSLVKWWLQSACMYVCVCVHARVCASSWAHSPRLKRTDRQTAARGCQHSTLISPWWIEWKTCLILFFLLVPALIDLQQHWNQYRIALFHSIESRHTFCFDKKSIFRSFKSVGACKS